MLMKEMLSNKNWKDKVFEISQQAYEIYDFFPPTKEEVYQRFGTYTNVYKWLISNLPGNSKEIILEPEVNFERITGHPDLVINTKDRLFVLDIKTTVNFERMEKETILQLLSYLALLKATGQAKQKIHTIGVVLPFERKIIVYDVKNFDVKFLKELSPKNEVSNSNVILSFFDEDGNENIVIGLRECCIKKFRDSQFLQSPQDSNQIYRFSSSFLPGSHISKIKGCISESIKTFTTRTNSRFCQMFLRSPMNGGKPQIYKEDVKAAFSVIKTFSMRYFTHTPYIINLCDPCTRLSVDEKDPYKFCLSLVRKDLRITKKMGGMGVVIHTGKSKKMEHKEAVERMVYFVKKILREATPECPLLLETGAGQGTELFCESPVDFYRFLRGDKHFTKEEESKLFACVDTCHVWASGHDPDEYLQTLQSLDAKLVKLVHFNGCKDEKGCRRDRHDHGSDDKIPKETMDNVLLWCQSMDIPLVCE